MGRRYDTVSLCARHKTFTAISSSFYVCLCFVLLNMQTHNNTHKKREQWVVRADRIEQGYVCWSWPVIFTQSMHHMMNPWVAWNYNQAHVKGEYFRWAHSPAPVPLFCIEIHSAAHPHTYSTHLAHRSPYVCSWLDKSFWQLNTRLWIPKLSPQKERRQKCPWAVTVGGGFGTNNSGRGYSTNSYFKKH